MNMEYGKGDKSKKPKRDKRDWMGQEMSVKKGLWGKVIFEPKPTQGEQELCL